MLPDLLGMLGMRVTGLFDAELSAGVDYHHATDAAFHAAPRFIELCTHSIASLTESGVERGTARAVAHVGVELLLDGALSSDLHARRSYEQALRGATAAPLHDLLALAEPRDVERLRHGLTRLTTAPVPEGYLQPDFVAERLEHILGSRPRLAMRRSDMPIVRRWAQATHAAVHEQRDALLTEVRAKLLRASGL